MSSRMHLIGIVSFALLAPAVPGTAQGQPLQYRAERAGRSEFVSNCATCHGLDARGAGPLAAHLNVRPPDLTRISRANNGQFPFLRIFNLVDGRPMTGLHSVGAMPIFGDRFAMEMGERYGPYGAETVIRGRIYDLVRYLETIQE